MKKIVSIVLLYCLCMPILAQQLDYSDSVNWYTKSFSRDKTKVDVFYLLPTCVTAWENEDGQTQYNADDRNLSHLEAWKLSCELAQGIFGEGTNFYLPYYRQTTFGAPDEGQRGDSIRAIAVNDVINSFDYYLTNYNQGRRFILAGFSQGALMLIHLLKHMDDATYNRMIAAYAIGGCVTSEDIMNKHVKLAQGEKDKGVVICFNTVADMKKETHTNLLFPKNIACINPINWTTGTKKAILKDKKTPIEPDDPNFPYGTAVVPAKKNKKVTVRINPRKKLLVVKGLSLERYHLDFMDDMFPLGYLHLQEPFFYAEHLKRNMKVRSAE